MTNKLPAPGTRDHRMSTAQRVVVVGAGIAGVRVVESLRENGFEGALTVVDADPELPYDRPPLSKEFLTGVFDEDDFRLWSADRITELRVELRLSTRAVGLDTARRRVAVRSAADGADELAYDRLVLATGVAPRRPAAFVGLDGVHTLRSLADARALRDALRTKPGPVVVVGGGFIGGEVATSAGEQGLDVTIVEGGGNLLPSVLTPGLSRPLERLHEASGVRVICGRTVAALHGQGSVESVELADGTRLPAGIVVLGLGGAPETGWLDRSGLQLSDGVHTDEGLRTPAEGVYAIGDIARRRDSATGALVRLQHWTSAHRQAAHVARDLLGTTVPYRDVPFIWTDQHGARLQIAGVTYGDEVRFVDGGPDTEAYLALVRRGPDLAGVIALGRMREFQKMRRLLSDPPRWQSVVAGTPDLDTLGAQA